MTFKLGDRVRRFQDTTGFNFNYYHLMPGTVVGFSENTEGRPLVDVNIDGVHEHFGSACFYPEELEHIPQAQPPSAEGCPVQKLESPR